MRRHRRGHTCLDSGPATHTPLLPLQMFKGDIDRPSAYEGPRDEAGIIKYLKKQVRLSVLEAAPPCSRVVCCASAGQVATEKCMHAGADCVTAQLRSNGTVFRVCSALCGRRSVSLPVLAHPRPASAPAQVLPAAAHTDSKDALEAAKKESGKQRGYAMGS